MLNPVDFILIPIMISIGFIINERAKRSFPFVSKKTIDYLYVFHLGMALVYFIYAKYNSSDSAYYYTKVVRNFRGEEWFNYFKTGTPFIEFIGWPLIKLLGAGYESVMLFFALLGYIGMLFFYLLFVENIKFKHVLYGKALFPLILFLPNMHFWTASFGKGSIIFLGIGAFFFAISKINKRWMLAAFALLIIYYVRPHIAFIFIAASGLALLLGSKGIKTSHKIGAFIASAVVFVFIYDKVFAYVGIEEDGFESVEDFAGKYIFELGKAGSAVDISNYNLLQKMATFLFRPLFFDANGMLGYIVSVENVFYVILSIQLVRLGFIKFMLNADFITKTAFISFLGASAALSQITSNLGIAIRMKSMVMFLLLFVIFKYMDYKKWQIQKSRWLKYLKQIRMERIRQPLGSQI
jgi:membrane protein implicated in regulation of membrane protease activity